MNARVLKIELLDVLPKGFNPSQIDSRLLRSESNIALLGIALVNPNCDLVRNANQIISAIRAILKKLPQAKVITVKTSQLKFFYPSMKSRTFSNDLLT